MDNIRLSARGESGRKTVYQYSYSANSTANNPIKDYEPAQRMYNREKRLWKKKERTVSYVSLLPTPVMFWRGCVAENENRCQGSHSIRECTCAFERILRRYDLTPWWGCVGSAIGLKWWYLLDVAFGIYKGLILDRHRRRWCDGSCGITWQGVQVALRS